MRNNIPGSKENTEERVYREIVNLILRHQYKPGDILLESELASSLKVSPTPVSKALTRLVSEGFLERKRKRGCIIPFPTAKDAKEVFFARMGIEGLVACAAAENAADEEILEIQNLILKEKEAVARQEKELYAEINRKFHLGLADICRNSYLQKCVHLLFWRSSMYTFFFDSFYEDSYEKEIQMTPAQHQRILDAISRRDPDNAEKEMKAHIRRSYDIILSKQLEP